MKGMNVNLDLDLFLILKTSLKLAKERISHINISRVDIVENDNFRK